jgi:MtaA/CmuA family methyltransferase
VRYPLAESATVEWHPVERVADLEQYKVIEPLYDGRIWVFLETVRLLKAKLQIPVGAFVSGPFTLAGLMMGANDVALATLERPEVVLAAVNFCEHVVIDFAKALQRAGADMICILDPTAVILSPPAYWEFAGRSTQNVIRHLDTRTMLHICGDTTHLVDMMCDTGVQALSLDSLVSLPEIAPRVPSDVVLMGNVNPIGALLRGTPDEVREETTALLDAMAGYENFIASTGCDLPAETPIANIAEFVETVKGYGRQRR